MKSFPKRRLALRPESACTLPVPPMTAYESVNKPYPPQTRPRWIQLPLIQNPPSRSSQIEHRLTFHAMPRK
jgi:hypothetical protein